MTMKNDDASSQVTKVVRVPVFPGSQVIRMVRFPVFPGSQVIRMVRFPMSRFSGTQNGLFSSISRIPGVHSEQISIIINFRIETCDDKHMTLDPT